MYWIVQRVLPNLFTSSKSIFPKTQNGNSNIVEKHCANGTTANSPEYSEVNAESNSELLLALPLARSLPISFAEVDYINGTNHYH
jgi:hypothetical protein